MAQICLFASNFAPVNWAFCQGQLLAIAQNDALFALIGTTFGGDGQTTFALPDLRGRVPIHTGQGPGMSNIQLGQASGTENVTLTVANMPSHNHSATLTVGALATNASTNNPNGKLPANGAINAYVAAASADQHLAGVTGTTGQAGNSVPFSIRQPYLGMNYIICLFGIFPSQN